MRPKRERRARPAILIVTEGRNTEPEYLEWLRDVLGLRSTVDVEVRPGGNVTDPVGLVELATALAATRERKASKSNAVSTFDSVWVVFDTEATAANRAIALACEQATKAGFNLAISRPAFEVWFLLHFARSPKSCATAAEAVRALRKIDVGVEYEKRSGCIAKFAATIAKQTVVAVRNADATRDDVFSRSPHPSLPVSTGSGVGGLVRVLVEHGTPGGRGELGFVGDCVER